MKMQINAITEDEIKELVDKYVNCQKRVHTDEIEEAARVKLAGRHFIDFVCKLIFNKIILINATEKNYKQHNNANSENQIKLNNNKPMYNNISTAQSLKLAQIIDVNFFNVFFNSTTTKCDNFYFSYNQLKNIGNDIAHDNKYPNKYDIAVVQVTSFNILVHLTSKLKISVEKLNYIEQTCRYKYEEFKEHRKNIDANEKSLENRFNFSQEYEDFINSFNDVEVSIKDLEAWYRLKIKHGKQVYEIKLDAEPIIMGLKEYFSERDSAKEKDILTILQNLNQPNADELLWLKAQILPFIGSTEEGISKLVKYFEELTPFITSMAETESKSFKGNKSEDKIKNLQSELLEKKLSIDGDYNLYIQYKHELSEIRKHAIESDLKKQETEISLMEHKIKNYAKQ